MGINSLATMIPKSPPESVGADERNYVAKLCVILLYFRALEDLHA